MEGGLWSRLNSYTQERNRLSEDKNPQEGSPQLLEFDCPSPSILWGSPPQLQADSSLPFPTPARAPGPGEFRHPSLQLRLHLGPGAKSVSGAWLAGSTKGLVFLAGVGPKQDLASPSHPPSSCCCSHLLSSQYVERHFSREGTTQHSTVSDSGRDQWDRGACFMVTGAKVGQQKYESEEAGQACVGL